MSNILTVLKSLLVVSFVFAILIALLFLGKYPAQVQLSPSGCINTCGNGICETIVCMSLGCSCSETIHLCPQDCKVSIP